MLNNFLFVHAIGLYLSIHSYNCSFIYFTLIVEEMTLSLRYKYQNNNKEDLISTSKINIASARSLEILRVVTFERFTSICKFTYLRW